MCTTVSDQAAALRLLSGPSIPSLVWSFLVHALPHVQVSTVEFTVSLFTFLTVSREGGDSLYAALVVLS